MKKTNWIVALAIAAGCARLAAPTMPPDEVQAACAALADLLTTYTQTAPVRAIDAFPDGAADGGRAGCTVGIVAPPQIAGGGSEVAEDVRRTLGGRGWREDISQAADGPDGTAFALRKDGVLCSFAGSWDGGDDADPDYVPRGGYELTAHCALAGR